VDCDLLDKDVVSSAGVLALSSSKLSNPHLKSSSADDVTLGVYVN